MSTHCLSLHSVAYDTVAAVFHAEAQFVSAAGVQRRRVEWRGPTTADFARIARGLRDAALSVA
ncbi:hypothetical protein [Jannaschia sp. CCS1]|uniref:hypothetical protein n=1 Tax=Jannaschia sp. (strain CCS1) TaxID=290400 RepID=UPI000053DB97|nr:hypothetical protein [Jannaschia sp. CCS1]